MIDSRRSQSGLPGKHKPNLPLPACPPSPVACRKLEWLDEWVVTVPIWPRVRTLFMSKREANSISSRHDRKTVGAELDPRVNPISQFYQFMVLATLILQNEAVLDQELRVWD